MVDGTDNVEARYVLSDACVLLGGVPLISGAAVGVEGYAMVLCERRGRRSRVCVIRRVVEIVVVVVNVSVSGSVIGGEWFDGI